jgi:hypothetical protein
MNHELWSGKAAGFYFVDNFCEAIKLRAKHA